MEERFCLLTPASCTVPDIQLVNKYLLRRTNIARRWEWSVRSNCSWEGYGDVYGVSGSVSGGRQEPADPTPDGLRVGRSWERSDNWVCKVGVPDCA